MAFRGVIDQDDYGATFERDDGSQIYLTGQQARELAASMAPQPQQEIPEEQEPRPQQATLYNDIPEQAQELTDIHPMAMAQAAPAQQGVSAGEVAASALQTPDERVDAGLNAFGASPAQLQALAQQPAQPEDGLSDEERNYINAPVRSGGRAAYDPNALNKSGVMLNKGQTVTGALPQRDEDIEARAEANTNLRMVRQEGA